jgi:hypothetical protein
MYPGLSCASRLPLSVDPHEIRSESHEEIGLLRGKDRHFGVPAGLQVVHGGFLHDINLA